MVARSIRGSLFVSMFLCRLLCALNLGPGLDLSVTQTSMSNVPQIASNSNGAAVAIWQETNDSVPNIFARAFNGTNWTTVASNLNNNSASTSDGPQVAINSNGVAVAVWTENNNFIPNVYARVFDGVEWSETSSNLNVNANRVASVPQIAINDSGMAVAVWKEYNGSTFNIYARIFNGTSWSETVPDLNADVAHSADAPRVAINDSGVAVAVWQEYTDDSVLNIYARTFSGGAWSLVASDLNNNTAEASRDSFIVINVDSKAIAVWSEYYNNKLNVYARTFDGASWLSTSSLNSDVGNNASSPRVAINDGGIAVAVWLEQNNDDIYNIYARIFDGTTWAVTVSNLNTNATHSSSASRVALNNEGTAIAAWREDYDNIMNVYMRTFDGDNWSALASNINDEPNRYNVATFFAVPQVTINDDNGSFVIWSEPLEAMDGNIFVRQAALPYTYAQWLSSTQGTKQYVAACRSDNAGVLDIYEYLPTITGLEFITSVTFTGVARRFAVYNKSDTELYIAVLSSSNSQIFLQTWIFNGVSIVQAADLSAYLPRNSSDVQWWATSEAQTYLAITGTDSSHLSVLDLVDLARSGSCSASGANLLWTAGDDYTGLVVLDGATATPYKVDFDMNPLAITPGSSITAPTGFVFGAISTCGDYIAVGLSSTDTIAHGFAQVRLLTLDTQTNALAFSGTSTVLEGQVAISSLARCCCCALLRPLIVGSYDVNRNYNINILTPDLSQAYISTLLGNNVESVAWSCQGDNQHFAGTSAEDINGFKYTALYNIINASSLSKYPIILFK